VVIGDWQQVLGADDYLLKAVIRKNPQKILALYPSIVV
jgi:hypothetical protein